MVVFVWCGGDNSIYPLTYNKIILLFLNILDMVPTLIVK